MKVEVFDDDGRLGRRRAGRARVHGAVSEHAGRVLERSRRREVPRGVLRAVSRTSGVTATGPSSPSTTALIIYGRSDATLNPGGVRIGTAEIYRQVEQLPEVVESLVIGQDVATRWRGDVRIVLFVRLADGDVARRRAAATGSARRSATNASPHHVPKKIVQVRGHPAHDQRQDHRARRARRRPRAAGEERRRARESGGAGAVPGSAGTADV